MARRKKTVRTRSEISIPPSEASVSSLSSSGPTPTAVDDEPVYEVERLLKAHRGRMVSGEWEYLVKWKGYPGQDSYEPEHNLNCPAKIKEFWKNRLFVRNNARDGTTVDFIHIPRPRRPSEIVGQKKKQRTSDAALSISPERTASPSVVAEEEYAETDGRGKRRRLDGPASSLRQGKGKGKGMGRAFPLPPHSSQSSTSTLTSLSPDLSVPVPEPDLPLDLDFPRSLSPPFSRYTSSSPRPTSPSSNDTLQRIPMSSLYGDLASWEDLNLDDLSLRRTEGELVWDFYRVENGYLRFFEAPHAEMEQKAPRILVAWFLEHSKWGPL